MSEIKAVAYFIYSSFHFQSVDIAAQGRKNQHINFSDIRLVLLLNPNQGVKIALLDLQLIF